jgi:hypothetical protein
LSVFAEQIPSRIAIESHLRPPLKRILKLGMHSVPHIP